MYKKSLLSTKMFSSRISSLLSMKVLQKEAHSLVCKCRLPVSPVRLFSNQSAAKVPIYYKRPLSRYGFIGICATTSTLAVYYLCKRPNLPIWCNAYAASINEDEREPIQGQTVTSLENLPDLIEKMLPAVVTVYCVLRGAVDTGSGFFISNDGLLMTNYHVVGHPGTLKINVKLHDGTTLPATLIGADVEADLALLKVLPPKPRVFPFLKMGDTSHIRQGEFVLAVGRPHSLNNTVTVGVVSSKARELVLRDSRSSRVRKPVTFIQTDAAITSGNSGGPLVNLRGEVIGVNSMRIEAGISFAVSIENTHRLIEYAQKHMEDQPNAGSPKIPSSFVDSPKTRSLGIVATDLSEEMWQILEASQNVHFGVYVRSVMEHSIACKAGVRMGDIITHVNGRPVRSAAELKSILQDNANVKLTVVRGQRILDFPNISLTV